MIFLGYLSHPAKFEERARAEAQQFCCGYILLVSRKDKLEIYHHSRPMVLIGFGDLINCYKII